MSAALRAVACAALVVLVAITAPLAVAHAQDDAVLVVGDSLAVGTQPYLGPLLEGRTVVSDVRNGITTPQGMRLVRIALRTVSTKTVVLSLGTNDGGDPRRFADRLRRTMALLRPDACVVWATIIRPPRKGPYRDLNRVLHQAKRRDPRIDVVD